MLDIRKKLEEEITALEYELRNELPREILRARAHGDLSENAEYHAAKERQGFVNARLGQLQKRLGELSMIDMTKIPHDKVGLGSRVVVLDVKKDEQFTYYLVTSERPTRPPAGYPPVRRSEDRCSANKWATPLICRRPAAQRNWKSSSCRRYTNSRSSFS
jgi:hypothetical protein